MVFTKSQQIGRQIEINTFVQDKFAEYYSSSFLDTNLPLMFENREFGVLLFHNRMMLRHKGFTKFDDLRSFLQRVVPSDVFYSSAYYENPEAEMDAKGWLGADLVFDIDADHIPTSCPRLHDVWICSSCGTAGRGASPRKCPVCNRQKFDDKTWLCEDCLTSAKMEIIKLLEFLINDFGLSLDEVTIAFSGHRGYHLRVDAGVVRDLDALARKEIVDYVTGVGIDPMYHGLETGSSKRSSIQNGPDLHDPGWRGRIAKGTYDFLLSASQEELDKLGLTKTANLIIRYKDNLVESWEKRGPWRVIKGIGLESWRKIIHHTIDKQSVKIDTVVTSDIHRLMRLTNTLHGKTGLKKIEVPTRGIEDFDPLKQAVAFTQDVVTVTVLEAPQFRLGDELYGPYKDETVEVPTSVALLLCCKDVATVKGEDKDVS